MSFIKFFVFFLFLLPLLCCKPTTEDNEPIPQAILSEEIFISVLTDAYLAEGAAGINIKGVSGEKFDSTYAFNVIKEHNISKEKFDSTLVYYTAHPKRLKLIYDKVLDRLSQIQAKGKLTPNKQ